MAPARGDLGVERALDALEPAQRPQSLVDALEVERGIRRPRVFVSALTGEGLDELRSAIAEAVYESQVRPPDHTEHDERFERPDNAGGDDGNGAPPSTPTA